jgi:hypothetical protein
MKLGFIIIIHQGRVPRSYERQDQYFISNITQVNGLILRLSNHISSLRY